MPNNHLNPLSGPNSRYFTRSKVHRSNRKGNRPRPSNNGIYREDHSGRESNQKVPPTSTAVIGGPSPIAPGLIGIKEFGELPQGLSGNMRADALSMINSRYDRKVLITSI